MRIRNAIREIKSLGAKENRKKLCIVIAVVAAGVSVAVWFDKKFRPTSVEEKSAFETAEVSDSE